MNNAEEVVKERFYDTLNSVSKDTTSHDMVIFARDFNAIVDDDRYYCPEVLGSYGLVSSKEYLQVHMDPLDGTARNHIDLFLVNRKWRSSLQDVRTLRRADTGSGPSLLIAKVLLKLKTPEKKTDLLMPLYDTDKLTELEVRSYDYSSMIAPGYNDPSAPIVYGISRYPNHIKSTATGVAKVFAADTNSNFITSDPAWKFGPAPLTQHAASYLAGNGPMRRNYNTRQARLYQSLPYNMPYY
ncbi:hypothetical protein QYM36_014904 [Artemia franciscana]|uniref:Uncharacterized protein n=1 Tax=Artemia franciscana TaxID=6661 RepID=A0AA88H822_ARTSF|nr:hypothetical protein QYM36_014904 [Artemia franciscana]